MPPTRPRARTWRFAVLMFLVVGGCEEERAPPPGTGLSPPSAGGNVDASAGDGAPRSPRPSDGPRLPPADAELEVMLDGESQVYRIEVEADLSALDVHFSIDTTASIGAEIDQLQRDLEAIVIGQLRERVADVSFGVSRFEDFPEAPFGADGARGGRADSPFELLTPITADVEAVSRAVAFLDLPLGFGGDNAEAGAEALYQIATGEGYRDGSSWLVAPFEPDDRPAEGSGTLGGVGFREGALHVVMHVTDAPSHTPDDYSARGIRDAHSLDDAATALSAIDARLIGIVTGLCPGESPTRSDADAEPDGEPIGDCDPEADSISYLAARAQLGALARLTGAMQRVGEPGCPEALEPDPATELLELSVNLEELEPGCPLVFDVAANGVGLSDAVVDSVVTLVDGVRFERVVASVVDDPLGFVERIVPVQLEQDDDIEAPTIVDAMPEGAPDGEPDSFETVRARARLGFDVYLRNARIVPTDAEQRFRLVVAVQGDELLIAEATLRVVIPAGPPQLPASLLADDEQDAGSP